jgi:Glycosyltransferase (GlcNAc)
MKDKIKEKFPNIGYHDELEYAYMFDSEYDLDKESRFSKKIFVSIPCYRDTEIVDTVKSLYGNAKNPDRVFVGIGLIYKESDGEFWKELEEFPNVKIDVKVAAADVVGLGLQRQSSNAFYNKEDYFLQVDAHSRFDMHWDDLLIHQLENLKVLGDPKPVISGYPRPFAPDQVENVPNMYPYLNPLTKELYFRSTAENSVPSFRKGIDPIKFFQRSGFPRHGDRSFYKGETLALCKTISPGQIFADGKYIKDVPANPEIRFLEEEQYYAILTYMKGYNCYTPRITGVLHLYCSVGDDIIATRPHPMDDFPNAFDFQSYDEDMLGGLEVFKKLQAMKNTPRSFKDYEDFSGVNYAKRKLPSPVDGIMQNKITAAVNFISELDLYADTDYTQWMYNPSYEFYHDVKRNENL